MPRIETVFVAFLLCVALVGCANTPDPAPTTLPPIVPTVADTVMPQLVATDAQPVSETPEIVDVPTQAAEIAPLVVATDLAVEHQLIGKLMVTLLRENGVPVTDQIGLGDARTVRTALESGEADMVLALTGLTLTEFQNIPPASLPTEAERSYQLAKTLDESNGLTWLESADYNATPVMLVREFMSEQGIRTLDDLAAFTDENRIQLCLPDDYTDVKLSGLLDMYALRIAVEDILYSSPEEVLISLRNGACHVALGHIADGRIEAWELSIVLDNRGYFPINNPAPVVRAEVLDIYPQVQPLMVNLFEGLSGRVIQTMSAQIVVGEDGEPDTGDERTVDLVAQRYLERSGLLGDLPAIRVGITRDRADGLLGLLLAFELLESGFEVQDRTYADASLLRTALEQGEVDVAWDESAYALIEYHNIPQLALPQDADAMYRLAQSLDLQYHDLLWQQPARLNAGESMFTTIPALDTIEDVAMALTDGANLRLCLARGDFEGVLERWIELYPTPFSAESIVITEPELVLPTVGNGNCDVGISTTVNPQAVEFRLKRLADTNNYLRQSSIVPIVRQDVLNQHPQIAALLSSISELLNEETYLAMQTQITLGTDELPESGDEADVTSVARAFLDDTRILRQRPEITIGTQNFTETLLLAEMTRRILEEEGFDSIETIMLDPSVSEQYLALQENRVEITWIYLGAALQVVHNQPVSIGDTASARQRVAELDQNQSHQWLQPTAFNNTFALLINPSQLTTDPSLTTISELASYMNDNDAPLSICVEEDFFKRPDGLQALQVAYGFEFDAGLIRVVGFNELYTMLAAGECDIAEGFQTDGRIEANGFRSLQDDRNIFPAYNAAPVIQSTVASAYPNLVLLLERLSLNLTNERMVELNALVDYGADAILNSGDEEAIETVAELFLCEAGLLIRQCPTTLVRPKTVVSAPLESDSGCETLDLNGEFETVRQWEIPNTRVFAKYSTDAAHSGNASMRLGIESGQIESYSIVEQTVLLPEDTISAELSFWYLPKTTDTQTGDMIALQIYDLAITNVAETLRLQMIDSDEWIEATLDLSAYIGEPFELYFVVVNDGDAQPTLAYLDDVSIEVCRE